MSNAELKKPLTISQAAKFIGVNRKTASALIRAGQLRAFRSNPLGTRPTFKVTEDAIREFQEQNKVVPA